MFQSIIFATNNIYLKNIPDFFFPSPCRLFIENASSSDKTFVPIEGAYHEVMFEDCGPAVVQGMIDWMLARSGNENGAGAKM